MTVASGIDRCGRFANSLSVNLPSAIVSSPPREIPFSTRLVLLTGGKLAWMGWIFAAFGLIFGLFFASHADLSQWFMFRGELQTATGKIVESRRTHASEGGGKGRRGTPIYEHHYRFTVDGNEFNGTSFCTGGDLRDRETVTVEFPFGDPEFSRIHGMRRAIFGPGLAFLGIFAVAGLVFIVLNLRTGLKNVWLLTHGEAAPARNTGKEITNTKVNNRRVYKVWFDFTDRNGAPQRTFIRTSQPEKVEGRQFEELFYDPKKPSRSTLLHNLPGNVTLDERGGINPCRLGAIFVALLGPFIAFASVTTAVISYLSFR